MKEFKLKWRIWVQQYTPDFLWLYPFDWLISVMCLLTAIPNLLGQAPNSVQDSLPPVARLLWALSLLLGGGALFIGLTWHKYELQRQGYGLLSLATVVYAAVLVMYLGTKTPPFTFGIFIVFALCCGLRRFKLTTLRKLAIVRVEERNSEDPGQ